MDLWETEDEEEEKRREEEKVTAAVGGGDGGVARDRRAKAELNRRALIV